MISIGRRALRAARRFSFAGGMNWMTILLAPAHYALAHYALAH